MSGERCGATVTPREGWGTFYARPCNRPAKGERKAMSGKVIPVCGIHLRGGPPFTYAREALP